MEHVIVEVKPINLMDYLESPFNCHGRDMLCRPNEVALRYSFRIRPTHGREQVLGIIRFPTNG
jgi:hypothetical protein